MGRIWMIALLVLTSCATSGSGKRGLFDSAPPSPTAKWESSGSEEGGQCRTVSKNDRLRLLELADPENFPRTRYREGPRYGIEKETDCSHFVHEIYKRAGLKFGFQTTKNLKHAPEFELLPESAAKPGDLMLFRGHVGIVDEDGKIISATRNRRHRKSSITRMDRSVFRRYRGARPVLRYRCHDPVRQVAQERR
jgi:hypothetical protein